MPQSDMRPRPIDAVLLDMDGTILNSIPAAERIWAEWALHHGLDVAAFLPTIHGVQSVETIRRLGLPGVDPVAEAERITRAEIEETAGIEQIAGAADFLAAIGTCHWAVVTSAPRSLALSRIAAASLPMPPLLIAAEDVERGKPAPDCFLLAAERLGTTAERCLVLEDSPAGIAAAKSAGAQVLVVTATHRHELSYPHAAIADYHALAIGREVEGLRIRLAAASHDDAWLLGTF